MQTRKKSYSPKTRTPHIDFKPAELKEHSNDNWIIVFYWKPINGNKMKRFRRRVKYMNSRRERKKYANIKIKHINELLASGWSPVDDKMAFNGSFIELLDQYIEHYRTKYANGKLRFDTYRTNQSFVKSVKTYLRLIDMEQMACNGFTKKFAIAYLSWKEIKCKVAERTLNNHLSFLYMLNAYMVDQEILENNVIKDIPVIKINRGKIRQRIPDDIKIEIFNYYKEKSTAFYTLCLMTYLCFIRRTEMTKLKVKDIDISKSLIKVPAKIAKSKKDGYVTIPYQYINILSDHIKYADKNSFVFSADHFKPGGEQMKPRKISDYWYLMRKKLDLPDIYQFYSLKDTGITENFEKGIPAIKIRNQARHENISTTELYAPKRHEADQTIRKVYYEL